LYIVRVLHPEKDHLVWKSTALLKLNLARRAKIPIQGSMTVPLLGKMLGTATPAIDLPPQDDVILEISPELVQLFFFVFCAWGMLILFEIDVIRRKVVGGFGDFVSGPSVTETVGASVPPVTTKVANDNVNWVTSSTVESFPKSKQVAKTPPNMVTLNKIMEVYPGAVPNSELVSRVSSALEKYGYGETTLLATSLCCDEVNRELDLDFSKVYGEHFSMGGLAGFAFGGVTSFGAMAHHIPTGGDCLVIYGPHVGVDAEGNAGKINRRGRKKSGACCGSGVAAAGYVEDVRKGKKDPNAPSTNALDAQQNFVGNLLLPHGHRLEDAKDKMVELPLAMFDAQNDLMHQIVAAGCGEVGGDGKIALLGGVQINTPAGTSDYFLPLAFEIRDNKGQLIQNLMW